MNITSTTEGKRGCGYRKPGGLYLMTEGISFVCYKLPIPLHVCPTCNAGIKPARGWTWIEYDLIKDVRCKNPPGIKCEDCVPFDGSIKRLGLLWIGERGYKTPEDFVEEALSRGVSRQIPAIPRDFVLGETWVLCAHQKALKTPVNDSRRGIFYTFKPSCIEYVVKDSDSFEKLERLEKRGVDIVKVTRDEDLQMKLGVNNQENKLEIVQ